MATSLTPFSPIVGFKPLTQITPFTYRDGATYADILYKFEQWLKEIGVELETSLNEYLVSMGAIEKSWRDAFDAFMADVVARLEALNDQAVANLVNNEASKLRIALDAWLDAKVSDAIASKVTKGAETVSVMDYGAKGDGSADDTQAFQQAADALPRGGVLVVPPREYVVNGEVKLNSGTHVSQYGATIHKTGAQSSYVVYALTAGSSTGRGGGKRNVSISGGTLRGNLDAGASINLVTAHRAMGLVVRDVEMIDYATNGHAIDLMGCDTVLIENCRFAGFKPLAGREYTEAIQLDSSVRQGAGFSAATIAGETWDGTPSRNITVQHNVFEGTATYPGQSPIGSHTWVIGNPMENIKFLYNTVRNTASVVNTSYPAILHFIGTTDIHIEGNLFEGVSGRQNRAIRANRGERGIPLSQVTAVAPVWADAGGATVNISRVRIVDNDFTDLSDSTGEAPHIIHFYGRDDFSIKNVQIKGNRFKRCQLLGAASGYLIQLGDTVGAVVEGNEYDSANGFLYVGTSKAPVVANNVGLSNTHYPVNVNTCERPLIEGNMFTGHAKGIIASACIHPTIANNVIDVTGDYGGVHVIAPPASDSYFNITGNKVLGTGAKTTNGIQATPSNYPNGVAVGNFVRGYTSPYSFAETAQAAANGNA